MRDLSKGVGYKRAYEILYNELYETGGYDYKNEEYPQNLLGLLFEGDMDIVFPPDIIGTLEYVLAEMLTKRESEIIHLRYQQKMTYEDIAERFGLTKERIRQIKVRAIAKLRHPSRRRFLLEGMKSLSDSFRLNKRTMDAYDELTHRMSEVENMLAQIDAHTKVQAADVQRPIETLGFSQLTYARLKRKGFDTVWDILKLPNADALSGPFDIYNPCYHEVIEKLKQKGYDIEHLTKRPYVDRSTEIELLDFSVRSFNCLKRAGLNTVGDILSLPDADALCRIKNLGERSHAEILDKLQTFGFNVDHLRRKGEQHG